MTTKTNFTVTNDGSIADVRWIEFAGGELHPKCTPNLLGRSNVTTITAELKSASDIVALVLLTDAVKRTYKPKHLVLKVPYVPYGRQDRVCTEGEAFGIKVMANIINSLGFDVVYTLMPHSDVTGALIDNVETETMTTKWNNKLIAYGNSLYSETKKNVVVLSPDAGATKRTLDFVTKWNTYNATTNAEAPTVSVVCADKVRNVSNGQIVRTTVRAAREDVESAHVIIYDDIVDGGMTFIKIAERLQELNPASVTLAAPHGIFSKGFEPFSNLIDTVITTNTFVNQDSFDSAADANIELIVASV